MRPMPPIMLSGVALRQFLSIQQTRRPAAAAPPPLVGDAVQISDAARAAAAQTAAEETARAASAPTPSSSTSSSTAAAETDQASDLRWELIRQVRQDIDAGVYDSPDKLAAALSRMLDRLAG